MRRRTFLVETRAAAFQDGMRGKRIQVAGYGCRWPQPQPLPLRQCRTQSTRAGDQRGATMQPAELESETSVKAAERSDRAHRSRSGQVGEFDSRFPRVDYIEHI